MTAVHGLSLRNLRVRAVVLPAIKRFKSGHIGDYVFGNKQSEARSAGPGFDATAQDKR